MKNFLKKSSSSLLLSLIIFFNLTPIVFAEPTVVEEPAVAEEPTEATIVITDAVVTSVANGATAGATTGRETGTPTPVDPPTPTTTQVNKTDAEKLADKIGLPQAFDEFKGADKNINKELQCLPADLMAGYFYTIMEEPLIVKEPMSYEAHKKLVDNGARYISKICLRNTLQYSIEANGQRFLFSLAPVLATKCSEKAEKLQNDYQYSTNPQIIFHCEPVQVLISKGGTSLLEGYLKTIYSYAASLAGLLAVSVIVVSGIQIAASGGDSGKLDEAKKRIIKSFVGIAILFLSGVILYTINPNFFVKEKTEPTTESTETQSNSGGTTPPPI